MGSLILNLKLMTEITILYIVSCTQPWIVFWMALFWSPLIRISFCFVWMSKTQQAHLKQVCVCGERETRRDTWTSWEDRESGGGDGGGWLGFRQWGILVRVPAHREERETIGQRPQALDNHILHYPSSLTFSLKHSLLGEATFSSISLW